MLSTFQVKVTVQVDWFVQPSVAVDAFGGFLVELVVTLHHIGPAHQ